MKSLVRLCGTMTLWYLYSECADETELHNHMVFPASIKLIVHRKVQLSSMRRELSSLEYRCCIPMVLKPYPIPIAAEIGYSLRRGRGRFLDCTWGAQTKSGPPVFLVLLRKDHARMNGTSQPNQK